MAVRVVAYSTLMVEVHDFPILGSIRLPLWQILYVGIARMSELCPDTTHDVRQSQILQARLRQFVLGKIERVEAELQFMPML